MASSTAPLATMEQLAQLNVNAYTSNQGSEYYINVIPPQGLSFPDQARAVFTALAEELTARGAHILEERVFAPAGILPELRKYRSECYGVHDDGVEPAWLLSPNAAPEIRGAQIHAIAGVGKPRVLSDNGRALGRTVDCPNGRWVTCTALGGALTKSASGQFLEAFETGERLLNQVGMDFKSVVRTWWWMRELLPFYDEFNEVRRNFFKKTGVGSHRGGPNPRNIFSPPASTGIGVAPMSGGYCAMDVNAFKGDDSAVAYYAAAGNQRSAFEYGSAFARGASLDVLGNRTVYVSGTADIDPEGRSCNIGDGEAQILATLQNVAAVLKDTGATMKDVIQVMAYSKTLEVERIFRGMPAARRLPAMSIVADVCRDELLFEMEVTAVVPGMSASKPPR